MPKSKKPQKKYQPKPKLLPLGVKRGVEGELPLHLAWEALGTGSLDFNHIAEFTTHAEILHRASPLKEMRTKGLQLFFLCESILQRYQAVGRLGVSGPEMQALQNILAETIPYVRTLPNEVIHKALKGGRK